MAKLLTILNVFILPKNYSVDFNDYFKSDEFACKCAHESCQTTLLSELTIASLYRSRLAANMAININSGYRCQIHNKEEGGSPTSSHPKGLAADVRKPEHVGDAIKLGRILKENFDLVLTYDTFWHCHNNPKG